MQLKLFQVDAFSRGVFGGNPAAVVPLERWLPDALLQEIAAENNLSETAFFVPDGDRFQLRWMTPLKEVTFCGHATLAAAHVILRLLEPSRGEVGFRALCGDLKVRADGALLAMDAPCWEAALVDAPSDLAQALGRTPREVLAAPRDYLVVYESEEEVRALTPDMVRVAALDRPGIIVTAPGRSCDFVSRYFAPQFGIPEDPVTGSAHSTLTPYWARRLGKTKLEARQVSRRGGELFCELKGERVITAGHAALYLEGTIEVPDARVR